MTISGTVVALSPPPSPRNGPMRGLVNYRCTRKYRLSRIEPQVLDWMGKNWIAVFTFPNSTVQWMLNILNMHLIFISLHKKLHNRQGDERLKKVKKQNTKWLF